MEKTLGTNRNAEGEITDQDDERVDVHAGNGNVSVTRRVTFAAGQADALFPDLTGGLFAFLKNLTRPHHNWTLIYSMAVAYILTVVPGVHLLGASGSITGSCTER